MRTAVLRIWIWIRMDPHQSEKQFPDPHQSGKLDPHQIEKQFPDPHHSEKHDPDLHQS
jgi:hypothetical protein